MNNYNSRGGGGFNKSRGNSDRGGFGGRSKFGGDRRDRDDRPMQKFSATCAACHKKCEVPFRPSGDKPVYCSDCFGKKNQDDHRDERGSDRRGGRNDRPDYTKLPRDQRPPRHDKSRGQDGVELVEIKRQLATIEARLNRILDVLNPPTEKTASKPKKEKPAKQEVDKPALKKTLEKVTEPVAAPKAVKKTAKKTAKKAVKKTVKKATKKVTKKTTKKSK